MSRICELTGKGRQVGNNVSHANNKTKRTFLPNLQNVTLISEALEKSIKLRVSTHGLRSVEHVGGLDNWLVKTSEDKLQPARRQAEARARQEGEVGRRLRRFDCWISSKARRPSPGFCRVWQAAQVERDQQRPRHEPVTIVGHQPESPAAAGSGAIAIPSIIVERWPWAAARPGRPDSPRPRSNQRSNRLADPVQALAIAAAARRCHRAARAASATSAPASSGNRVDPERSDPHRLAAVFGQHEQSRRRRRAVASAPRLSRQSPRSRSIAGQRATEVLDRRATANDAAHSRSTSRVRCGSRASDSASRVRFLAQRCPGPSRRSLHDRRPARQHPAGRSGSPRRDRSPRGSGPASIASAESPPKRRSSALSSQAPASRSGPPHGGQLDRRDRSAARVAGRQLPAIGQRAYRDIGRERLPQTISKPLKILAFPERMLQAPFSLVQPRISA